MKSEWSCNNVHQDLYDKARKIIKEDMCMTLYDVSRPLYLKTNASGVGIGAELLQLRKGMNYGHD